MVLQDSLPACTAVILAGGRGRRMGGDATNKVCVKIHNVPAINRAIANYQQAGIADFIVVVGAMAESVIASVSAEFDRVLYACQRRQRGSGDALAAALTALGGTDGEQLLLVASGDRIVDPEVIGELIAYYQTTQADIAFVALPGRDGATAGHVVTDEAGTPLAIVEPGELTAPRRFRFPRAGRAELELDSAAIMAQPWSNTSIYLGKLKVFRDAVARIHCDNRAGEYYLSDLVRVLADHAKIVMLPVADPARVLGFNNPAELLEVAETLRQSIEKDRPGRMREEYRSVAAWLEMVDAVLDKGMNAHAFGAELLRLYGGDAALAAREGGVLRALLHAARTRFGADAEVALVRSPGRVNVLGRHVDHQGGNCNLMTIGYETLMLVHLRRDDMVQLYNLDEEFAPASFSIGDLVRDLPWDDWLSLVNSERLAKLLKQYGVDWSDYIKAVFLRFQKQFPNRKLAGMDMIVAGNVPMAAGLSSSSTLVVGAAEAVVSANRLDLMPEKLVTLCGEGEWFVGTRGGAADHAAVKLGQCNKVVKVRFFDFGVEELVDFPADYALIVGDSGIKARKTSNAKDQFNHRVSCYRIGFLLLKRNYPQFQERLKHLRDVNTENLGVPLSWIYRMLLTLPEAATRAELEALLPEVDLGQFWANHAPPADGLYGLRGVVLYGLAECARAANYVEVLKTGDMGRVGHLMNISHDGDRVMSFDAAGENPRPFAPRYHDAALHALIADAESGIPARVLGAQLAEQPGRYACSLPEIDRMVDLALGVPGVAGAQLAGAGLGGCMMVMAQCDAVEALIARLTEKYYLPAGREPRLLRCRPIAGAGMLRFSDDKTK